MLLGNVVPRVKANTVAVASTWRQVVADPLSGVKEVVLNLLANRVVQSGVIQFAPRNDGLVHIIYGTAQCGKTGLRVLKVVVGLKPAQKGVDIVKRTL